MQPYLLCLLSVLSFAYGANPPEFPPVPKFNRLDGKNCPAVFVRKEWRLLLPNEQQDYIKAVLTLRKPPQKNAASLIDQMAYLHNNLDLTIHGTAYFLPWHRAFVLMHEEKLQTTNSKITQPYWNSNYDSQAWWDSPIFNDDAFGGNGNADDFGRGDHCVSTGSFAGAKVKYPKASCLKRFFQYDYAFPSTGTVNTAMMSTKGDFANMHKYLEGDIHGYPHMALGGYEWSARTGDWVYFGLATMYSPNDPIFFLHHGYIDKLWADWQAMFPDSANNYKGYYNDGKSAKSSDQLPFFNIAVSKVLKIKDLCYSYANLPPPPASNSAGFQAPAGTNNQLKTAFTGLQRRDGYASTVALAEKAAAERSKQTGKVFLPPLIIPYDKSIHVKPAPANLSELAKDYVPLLKLKRPTQIPDHWFKVNGIPLDLAHKLHNNTVHITREINNIPGYVSPCALWNREDLLTKATKKKNVKFCAAINGTLLEIDPNSIASEKKAIEIKSRIKASVVNDIVQKPIAEIYDHVYKVLGAPFYAENNAANPYRARRPKEIGFGRRTAELRQIKEELNKKLKEGYVVRNTPQEKPKLNDESHKKITQWQQSYFKKFGLKN